MSVKSETNKERSLVFISSGGARNAGEDEGRFLRKREGIIWFLKLTLADLCHPLYTHRERERGAALCARVRVYRFVLSVRCIVALALG